VQDWDIMGVKKFKLDQTRMIQMNILEETTHLVKTGLGTEYKALTVERVMMGLFFTGVKLSNSAGGSGYHFFDKLAPRIVIEKPSR